MKLARPLIVLDLETTGTWVEKDKIVEIGMIKMAPGGARSTYIKRVNPGIPIPPNVVRIINIRDEDVKDSPGFKDIAKEVLDFIGDCDIGGFNILRFDLPLLEREFYDAGMTFNRRDRNTFDAQKIYHIHEKRDLTAAYLMYCGEKLEGAHSALNDAEATVDILEAQIKMYGAEAEGVDSLRDLDYEQKSEYFDKERKFSWWNGELYPMFGKYGRKKHIRSIARDDREYLKWILTKDFSEDIKTMIRDSLDGRFPQAPVLK